MTDLPVLSLENRRRCLVSEYFRLGCSLGLDATPDELRENDEQRDLLRERIVAFDVALAD